MSVRNRVINPLVRALLHSPAHRVMSRGVLLLTYTGRRRAATTLCRSSTPAPTTA